MSVVDYDKELNNGWGKWQNLVLSALKEGSDKTDKIMADISELKVTVALNQQALHGVTTTQTEQAAELKVLQGTRTVINGVWKGVTLFVGASFAVVGLVTGLIQAGLLGYFGLG